MPCGRGNRNRDRASVSKRDFVIAAVSIGGASAVSALNVRYDRQPAKPRDEPEWRYHKTEDAQRQHGWAEFTDSDDAGMAIMPEHHVLLHLEYQGDGTPTEAERETVEEALQVLDDAYRWSNDGLLYTISYSQRYFDRYDEDLPDGTDLWYPEDVIEAADIDQDEEIVAESDDAHVHLASDNPRAVAGAEAALRGEVETANEVDVTASLDDVFEFVDRRTGFVDQRKGLLRKVGMGTSKPHERFGEDVDGENPVPEDAPVFFGFKSVFPDSQPHEDHVTITNPENPFADGTIQQVSLVEDHIEEWYDENDHQEQVHRMYSPHHSSEETGPHGRDLGPRSGTTDDSMVNIAHKTEADSEEGVVGHAQKLARARDPIPPVLRRDFPSTDGGKPHLQFISYQRTTTNFVDVRKRMSFVDPESDADAADELPLEDHGILNYMDVQRRGVYLVPPRRHRALPQPRPEV